MATNQIKLPEGFVLDEPEDINLPEGFVLDQTTLPIVEQTEDVIDKTGRGYTGTWEPSKPYPIIHPYTGQALGWQEEPPVVPESVKKYALESLPGIGATVGGLAPVALGITGVPGALMAGGLALVGGMGGKGFQQEITGRTMKEPMSKLYKEQLTEGAIQAAFELGGRAIAGIPGKIGRTIRGTKIPGADAAQELLEKGGAYLTPAQARQGLLDTLEGVAEGSFFGGPKVLQFKTIVQPAAFEKAIKSSIDDMAEGIMRMAPEDSGRVFLEAVRGGREVFNTTSKALYSKVDDLVKQTVVPTRILKEVATEEMDKAVSAGLIGTTPSARLMLKRAAGLPSETIDFRTAQNIRSGLLNVQRMLANQQDRNGVRIANKLISAIDSSMEEAAKNLPGDANKAWRLANRFFRRGMTRFNDDILNSIVRTSEKNPTAVAKMLFQQRNIEQIRTIKRMVPPKTFESIKIAGLEEFILQNVKAEGVPLGPTLLTKLERLGDDFLKEIWTPKQLQSIRTIAETANLVGAKPAGGGRMLVQLTQAGALVQLAGGAVTGFGVATDRPKLAAGGAVFLIGPTILAEMISKPGGAKFLRDGLIMPATAKEAPVLAARIFQTVKKYQEAKEQEEKIKQAKPYMPTAQKLRGFGGRGF